MPKLVVYVLECEEGKYYVGKTQSGSVESEFYRHQTRRGPKWTSRYKPISVLIDDIDGNPVCDYDTTLWTLGMMRRKGINNVRGGPYRQMEFSPRKRDEIQRKIDVYGNKCFNCGILGHLTKKCFYTHHLRTNRENRQ